MPDSPITLLEFFPAHTSPRLPENAIHIWRIELDRHPVEACHPLLSQDEKERARRFATETLQRRFSVARASLRRILAGYLSSRAEKETAPEKLIFAYGPNGKPVLAPHPTHETIRPPEFNLSHSGELALLAVSSQPVGLDLEPIRPLANARAIARRTLSASAISELERLPDSALPQHFFLHWTALEARAKLYGGGIFSNDRDNEPRTLHHFVPQEDWVVCLASNLFNPIVTGFQLAPNTQLRSTPRRIRTRTGSPPTCVPN